MSSGSVYQRKDGRWVAKITDQSTGKRAYQYARDEATAREHLADMHTRQASGKPAKDSRVTVKAYAERWLAERAGRRRAESTLYEYESRLRLHIYPYLGHRKLAQLRIPHIEEWFDVLLAKGLSPSSIRSTRNALAAVLTDAVKSGAVSVNVARLAELPTAAEKPPAPIVPPTVEATRRLLDLAVERDPELARLLTVMAGTGTRIGEVLAMKWSDLDGSTWSLARTITRDRQGRTIVGDTTKTREPRVVRLPASVRAALDTQRVAVAKARLKSYGWREGDWVWPSSIGTYQDPRNVRTRLRPIARDAGFTGSTKQLRHLFASLALESVEATVVAKMLGHRRASTTTDVYGHLMPETAESVANTIEDRLHG